MNGPYADLIDDINRFYGDRSPSRHAPHRRSRPPARPMRKSLAQLGRDMDNIAADLNRRIEKGWAARIAAGVPTEADLLKAYAVLDGAVGQVPAADLHAMDLEIRAAETRLHQTNARAMTKSMTAGIDLPRARAQLEAMYAANKITGPAYREADFKIRRLETARHG